MFQRRLFQLDDRLTLCANFVREGVRLADIGTDHGYLPIYLAKTGKITRGIAADINIGPLQKAAMHIKKYHAEDLVEARLSNGLEVIFEHEVDDIVIAGMGGELIARILEAAPWVKNSEKHLILQPMTGAEELRCYLRENGFSVRQEVAAVYGTKVYSVMLVWYDPLEPNHDPLFPYVGLLDGSDDAGRAYIEREIRFFQKKADGLNHAGQSEQAASAERMVQLLEQRLQVGKEKIS